MKTTFTSRSKQKQAAHRGAPISSGMDDLCLVDARAMAASGGMSRSELYDKLAAGLAPQPDVRGGARFVRWRVGTVRAWLASMSSTS